MPRSDPDDDSVVWGGTPSEKWRGESPVQWAEHFGRAEVAELLRRHLE